MSAAHVMLILWLWGGAEVSSAEGVPEAASAVKAPPIAGGNVKGRMVRVMPKQRQLVVRLKWRGTRTFEVAEGARITRNGDPVPLRRLRKKDQVRMTTKRYPDGRKVVIIHAWMPL